MFKYVISCGGHSFPCMCQNVVSVLSRLLLGDHATFPASLIKNKVGVFFPTSNGALIMRGIILTMRGKWNLYLI